MSKFTAHPAAIVESNQIGDKTRIWAFSHVQPKAVIGSECNIGENCFIENGALIGNRVTLKNGVCVWSGISVGDDVFIGPNATFTNDLYPRSPRAPHISSKYEQESNWLSQIELGEGCTVGANATIIGPVKLGRYCMIGAGTVVVKDVAPFELIVGNPGKRIGWVNEKGERVSSPPKSS